MHNMSKVVILTGLRANNDLHIGNYFGALLPIIDMARQRSGEFDVHLFVPDLHSFTTPIDHSQLQARIMHNLRLYAAAGLPLDNPNVHVYRQSYIPAHSELTVILNSFTGMGEMERMTQYKTKASDMHPGVLIYRIFHRIAEGRASSLDPEEVRSVHDFFETYFENGMIFPEKVHSLVDDLSKADDGFDMSADDAKLLASIVRMAAQSNPNARTSVGLFDYPVLMAADILLYGATYVPVGDDQTQHLEFTRDIAERMNSKFGELFVVPEPVAKQHEFFGNDQGLRIKDLADPSKKMSKSDENDRGIIFLGDNPDDAAKKVISATTDSEGTVRLDYEKQPGVSNLLQILALLQNKPLEDVARAHEGQDRYGDFKTEVAETVKVFLVDFQKRLAAVDESALTQKLQADEALMNGRASETLLRVQKAIGLR